MNQIYVSITKTGRFLIIISEIFKYQIINICLTQEIPIIK